MKVKASDKNITIPKSQKKAEILKMAQHREYLYKHPQLKSLFLEMTLNCNEHCRHCGSWCGDVKVNGTLSDDEIKNKG